MRELCVKYDTKKKCRRKQNKSNKKMTRYSQRCYFIIETTGVVFKRQGRFFPMNISYALMCL